MVNVELLQVLVCPQCNSPMVGEEMYLYCANEHCRRQYPLRSSMPAPSHSVEAEVVPVAAVESAAGRW